MSARAAAADPYEEWGPCWFSLSTGIGYDGLWVRGEAWVQMGTLGGAWDCALGGGYRDLYVQVDLNGPTYGDIDDDWWDVGWCMCVGVQVALQQEAGWWVVNSLGWALNDDPNGDIFLTHSLALFIPGQEPPPPPPPPPQLSLFLDAHPFTFNPASPHTEADGYVPGSQYAPGTSSHGESIPLEAMRMGEDQAQVELIAAYVNARARSCRRREA